MSIKVIFCDIGNVLVRNQASDVYQKYEKMGVSGQDLKSGFDLLHAGKESNLKSYLLSKNISEDVWKNFTHEIYSSERRNDDLYKILMEIKANSGMKIVYTTNNSLGLNSILEKYSLQDLPDLVVNSSLVTAIKPSSEYWVKAFDLTKNLIPDLKLSEVLVIDDSRTNVDSAGSFGFASLQYLGPQTDSELKHLLEPKMELESDTLLSSPDQITQFITDL